MDRSRTISHPEADAAVARCALCQRHERGRRLEIHYGVPSRGVSPKTFEADYQLLGTLHEFVCAGCENQLGLREALRSGRIFLGVAATSLVTELGSAYFYGTPLRTASVWLWLFWVSLLSGVVVIAVTRVSFRRRHLLAQQILDRQRPRIAAEQGRKPLEIGFYPPELVARRAAGETSG